MSELAPPLFPDPRTANEDGIVAVGGYLDPDVVLHAYEQGIFPWPVSSELPLLWFSPHQRAILEFDDVRISKSFRKFMRNHGFEITVNQAFPEVIRKCAETPRKDQRESEGWITPEMIECYTELSKRGKILSVETWDDAGELVGGIYGLLASKYCSAESMFHTKSNASKLALLKMIEVLKKDYKHTWFDIQVMTPHMERFGAKLLEQEDFLSRL